MKTPEPQRGWLELPSSRAGPGLLLFKSITGESTPWSKAGDYRETAPPVWFVSNTWAHSYIRSNSLLQQYLLEKSLLWLNKTYKVLPSDIPHMPCFLSRWGIYNALWGKAFSSPTSTEKETREIQQPIRESLEPQRQRPTTNDCTLFFCPAIEMSFQRTITE